MMQVGTQPLAELLPLLSRYAAEMTDGAGDNRFEIGLDVLVSKPAAVSEKYR